MNIYSVPFCLKKDMIALELKIKGLRQDKLSFNSFVNQISTLMKSLVKYYWANRKSKVRY